MRQLAAMVLVGALGCGEASAPPPPSPSPSPPPQEPMPIVFGDCAAGMLWHSGARAVESSEGGGELLPQAHPNPLRGETAALAACLRLGTQRYGGVVIGLGYAANGKVTATTASGLESATVHDCVTEVARHITRIDATGATQHCPLAFGDVAVDTFPAIDLVPTTDLASVTATTEAIVAKLLKPTSAAVFEPAPIVVLRPTAATPMSVLVNAMYAVLAANGDFVLATRRDAGWQLVSPIALPRVPVPRDVDGLWNPLESSFPGRPNLQVHVQATALQITANCTKHQIQRGELAAELVAEKRAFADRTDIELTPNPEITYGELVATIDTVTAAGFTAWVLDPEFMSPWDGVDRFGGGRCGTGGGMRGRTAAVPTISIGSPTVTGNFEKALVRRYIRRNINKLQYCYEKALVANTDLSGTVTATFTITGTGMVGKASATGVDRAVSTCVADVIRAIEFPAPKDGAPVQVSYPFDFRRSAG